MSTKVYLSGVNIIVDQTSQPTLTIRADRASYYLLKIFTTDGTTPIPVKQIQFEDTYTKDIRTEDIDKVQDSGGTPIGDLAAVQKYLNAFYTSSSSRVIYTQNVSIKYQDSPSVDAFGRARVSDTGQRLDVEFIYDKQEEVFDEILKGAGTVTHNANSRDLFLKANNAVNGDGAEMASYPVPYTPGNSQLVAITGTINEANIAGGTAEVFFRSNITGTVVETTYTQVDWSEDVMASIEWDKSQILEIDFQSLKVGRIRFGLNMAGNFIPFHVIENDNLRATGFWQQPSLPASWKIYNDATHTYCEMGYGNADNAIGLRYKVPVDATAILRAICCTVKSEGGLNIADIEGYARVADMGVTKATVAATLIPLISIRPKTLFQTFDNLGLVVPTSIGVSTDNPIRLVVIHNATLTAPTWVDVDTAQSQTEYDVSATGFTNGHEVFTDYVSTAKNTASSSSSILGKTLLWERKSVETGILTICAVRTTTTSADVFISLRFKEIR